MKTICFVVGVSFFIGCSKKQLDDNAIIKEFETSPGQYSAYTIQKGAHYCDQNLIKSIGVAEMNFMVKFDSSAIYQTELPENQYAVNKLWGFSEGTSNHYNSARIGWSWTDNALRLYGYAYVSGQLHYQEITSAPIGAEINCSIKLDAENYLFTVNGVSVNLPRGTSGSQASGYQQYPYFGGSEVAPHLFTILIKSL
ncbi:MAG TPA: hypothetical protein VFP97_17740 [Chitinophagaceae bacterium]|nr:hypothetical protein [Chitinophagaceae bacterium]